MGPILGLQSPISNQTLAPSALHNGNSQSRLSGLAAVPAVTTVAQEQRPATPAAHPHRLMVQPEAGIGPILAAIYNARSRVLLKIFALEEESLIQALVDAHQRGLECRVQLNPIRADGSRMNEASFLALRQAGVAVTWTNPSFEVTHEKTLVVDDQAYLCTFNFCRKFFESVRGYALITDQPNEVAEIVACFEADWHGREFTGDRLSWGGPESRRHIAALIDSAQHTLEIQHKKLADAAILAHLLEALARGVRVRFLGSGQKGVHGADLYENAAQLGMLKQAGGEVHKIKKPKIHTKLIVVDGRVAHVGSMNLTRHCFEHRREVGIVVHQEEVVSQLRRVFEQDWKASRSWTPPDPLNLAH